MSQQSVDSMELPLLPSKTQCVLMARDPNFIYAYWNYSQADLDQVRNKLRFESDESQLVLRIYDITLVNFNGKNANHTWDLDVGFTAKNWYVHVWQDNAAYCSELGLRSHENRFIPLVRSNTVCTPPKSTSKRDDLVWQDIKIHKESQPYVKEDIKQSSKQYQSFVQQHAGKKLSKVKHPRKQRKFYLSPEEIRAYYMKLFHQVSKKSRSKIKVSSMADILRARLKGRPWQRVVPIISKPDLIKGFHLGSSMTLVESKPGASELLSAHAGSASEGRLNKRKFFFEIWTELFVYGRTESDATVLLNQKGIQLNPDGTFTLRYQLPDGEIPLKFIAQSSDGVEQRHIHTGVEREKTISYPKMLKEFNG